MDAQGGTASQLSRDQPRPHLHPSAFLHPHPQLTAVPPAAPHSGSWRPALTRGMGITSPFLSHPPTASSYEMRTKVPKS